MIYLGKSLRTLALIVIMFFGSMVAGGVWGTIPAVFKARWNANETLFN
jgi:simple sugar transport system permease protein